MKNIFLSFLLGLCSICLHAQTIENNKSAPDGNTGKITISYDLIYTDATQKFNVVFFSSHDNYSKPLKQVTGDVGDNVLPGKMKRASWDATRELPVDFDGDILIKIKVSRIAAPKINVEPLALKTYKRGSTVSMKWTGGYPTDKITIQLKQNSTIKQATSEKIDNAGVYNWKVPKNVKGKNYSLILTNTSQTSEPVATSEFEVKPRVPLLVKILPVLAAGVAVILLLPDDPEPVPDEVLPPPGKPN